MESHRNTEENVTLKMIWIDRLLAVAALVLGIVSIFLKDVDKCPIYFMLAYVLLRLK